MDFLTDKIQGSPSILNVILEEQYSKIYDQGADAYHISLSYSNNPYEFETAEYYAWADGFRETLDHFIPPIVFKTITATPNKKEL